MRKWIVCLVIVPLTFALMGAEGGCEKREDGPTASATTEGPSKEKKDKESCPSDRVPADKPNIEGKRYVTIYGCAEESMGPLDLGIFVRDVTTGETGDHHEISAGGEVQYVIGYDNGHHVEITVEFKPTGKGSKVGFLYISDGPANRKFYYINKGWRAQTDPIFRVAR